MIIPFAPAALATRHHWRQSKLVGLKISSGSVPSPHSLSVNVLGQNAQKDKIPFHARPVVALLERDC
jgi:hypothetical protein